MERPLVGISLHSELEFLEHTERVREHEAEILEVTPETLWRPSDDPERGVRENDYHAMFAELKQRRGVPFIAHGVELSPGTARDERGAVARRTRQWLEQIRLDHACFDYLWYTEHMGWSAVDELHSALPLPLPFCAEAVSACRRRLALLERIVPTVGFENSANYVFMGDVADEPAFFNAIAADRYHVLLDLHNVHTECVNAGLDPFEYVERIDLSRVIEIHLAGGSQSEAAWLSSGATFRLDSHDGPVPETVWKLFEHVLPRCTGLRAVIVERMTGTLDAESAKDYADEFRRALAIVKASPVGSEPSAAAPVGSEPSAAAPVGSEPSPPRSADLPADAPPLHAVQRAFMEIVTAPKAGPALEKAREAHPELAAALGPLAADGLDLTALMVRKLRFERLLQGSKEAAFWFDERPEEFAAVFGDYYGAVEPTAVFPSEEADLFERWIAGR